MEKVFLFVFICPPPSPPQFYQEMSNVYHILRAFLKEKKLSHLLNDINLEMKIQHLASRIWNT